MAATPELPETLRGLLDGTDLAAKAGETFLLSTISEEGWPHLALLSVGEVYAPGSREIRLALWPDSTITGNLTRNGRASLTLVSGGAAYHVRLASTRGPDLVLRPVPLAGFAATVCAIRVDAVGYAELTSGVRFRLRDPGPVLERWAATVAALRTG